MALAPSPPGPRGRYNFGIMETPTPVHEVEEYIEQAYFFRVWRERLTDGRTTQDVLGQIHAELLASTRLPIAVDFLTAELRHSGELSNAFLQLPHYFTPLQSFVVYMTEVDDSRFTFPQALLILEREAAYRAAGATPAGLFVFQLEALSRNQLGYNDGLDCLAGDAFYSPAWRDYFRTVRQQLGIRDFAELVYTRSESFVETRRRSDPGFEPTAPVLFNVKEGKIAAANVGKDPMYLFATLQRQLGYPEVPRLPKSDAGQHL
ncbi:MAG: hypothetical protein ACRC1K_24715, partial [Planctomycetia bacterium]